MRCRKKIFMFSLLAKIFSQRHFKSSRKEIKSRKSGTGIIIFLWYLYQIIVRRPGVSLQETPGLGGGGTIFFSLFQSKKNMKIEGRSPSDWLTATGKKTSIIIFLSFSYSFPSFHFISIHHYFSSVQLLHHSHSCLDPGWGAASHFIHFM